VQPLVLYFNEYSCPGRDPAPDAAGVWQSWALTLWEGLREVRRYQAQYWVSFPSEQWHAICHGKPLSAWLQLWLGRDRYRWLLALVRNHSNSPDLCREVYYDDQHALGMTLALLGETWVFSFPKSDSPWLEPRLSAREVVLDESNGMLREEDCEILHIACRQHAEYWREQLADVGRIVAEANEITQMQRNSIDMYPLDHGYPHVHLVERLWPRRTLAKFRIDRFARLEGRSEWDHAMERWIEAHREELLLSWARCQRGGHPYRVAVTEE